MDKNLQNIEDLFRKGLKDKEEMPPPEVWEAIDKKLGNDNFVRIKYKYNQLKKATIFLAILLSGFIIYFLIYRHNNHELAKQNSVNTIQNSITKNNKKDESAGNNAGNLGSQVDSSNLIRNNKNFITAFYSPDISFYHLKDDHSGNWNYNTTQIENRETETFSSTAGTLIDYKM